MNDLSGKCFAIIGAGLAGVATAQGLLKRGATVKVFEKSRGFGGRCSSKRWENHVIDHGAQYFTMRDPRFREAATASCGESLWQLQAPVRTAEHQVLPDTGRWVHLAGNSRLVRDLAAGLELETERPIEHVQDLLQEFDHVISTAPWPQTAQIFQLEFRYEYIPCLAAVFAYHGSRLGRTADTYAFHTPEEALAWTACENHKPGRIHRDFTVLIAHLNEAMSREHLEKPLTEYPQLVRSMLEDRWQIPASKFAGAFGHRWRMARVAEPIHPPRLPDRLFFVGDALRQSRVEDAWLAGYEFAQNSQFA